MNRSRNFVLLAVALFMLAAAADILWLHLTVSLSNRMSDYLIKQSVRDLHPDPDIVIVDIDDASMAEMEETAGKWPWPRAVHAEMVRGIAKQQPKAIVFDIEFRERDVYRPESDRMFNQALDGDTRIFFPMVRLDPSLDAKGEPIAAVAEMLGLVRTPQAQRDARVAVVPPFALEQRYWRHAGTVNFLADPDGVCRRYGLMHPAYGWLIPSLPARVAKELGYPVPMREDMVLAWRGVPGAFRRVSYADLYNDFGLERPQRKADELKGKIVVIGAGATGLHDLRVTPLDNLHSGTEILATAIDNLKNQRMMRAPPSWFGPAFAAVLIGVLGLMFVRGVNALRAGLLLSAGTLAAVLLSYFAVTRLVLLPTLSPLIYGWACYFICALHLYLEEQRRRERTEEMFSRFVNPHVVQELLSHGGLNGVGESRQITVLFSDIRGFTTLSEKRSPQEVVQLLNRYFSLQVEVIFRHGGSLDKFIGDCIMAFWGAPLDDPQHALHSVQAALEMADVLQHFKQTLGADVPDFDIGIGIHSGPAVVALIGPQQRLEYTAIGDTVNLASRLEGLTKGVSRILVSRETMGRCGGALDFVSLGSYNVKGREEGVEVFAPVTKGT